jgi:hypothetical protein
VLAVLHVLPGTHGVRSALCTLLLTALGACTAPDIRSTADEDDGSAGDDAGAGDDDAGTGSADAGDDAGPEPMLCARGYRRVGATCVDIDECTDGVSGCPGDCEDVDGSFVCSNGTTPCPKGAVLNGSQCVDLGCSFYQRLPGPDVRVHFIIERSGSMGTQTGGRSRLDDARDGLLAALHDPFFADAKISIDLVPDVGQEAVCGSESIVELAATKVSAARAQLPAIFADHAATGESALSAGLERATHELRMAVPSPLAVLLFDGASATCGADSSDNIRAALEGLSLGNLEVLPVASVLLIGLSRGMTVTEETELESLFDFLANSYGGYSDQPLDTAEPATVTAKLQRVLAAHGRCYRKIPIPPEYVGSLDAARLFAGGIVRERFEWIPDLDGLGIWLEDDACELANGVLDFPVPADWYLGYGCSP